MSTPSKADTIQTTTVDYCLLQELTEQKGVRVQRTAELKTVNE
jgi:hypothetical protein